MFCSMTYLVLDRMLYYYILYVKGEKEIRGFSCFRSLKPFGTLS